MHGLTLTIKVGTLYAACSPELGVVSFGQCRDEALNNLAVEINAWEASRWLADELQT